MASNGKRAGSRRAQRRPRTFQPILFGLAAAVTLAAVAWGFLVYAAVDFGAKARGGDSQAWGFLGVAALGAVACLFAGLMLLVRLLRTLGITSAPPPKEPKDPREPRSPSGANVTIPPPPGGRRAAR